MLLDRVRRRSSTHSEADSQLNLRHLRDRIRSSQVALRDWSRPGADKEMVATIAQMEVNLLRELCEEAPAAEFDEMVQLIDAWQASQDGAHRGPSNDLSIGLARASKHCSCHARSRPRPVAVSRAMLPGRTSQEAPLAKSLNDTQRTILAAAAGRENRRPARPRQPPSATGCRRQDGRVPERRQ